MMTCTCHDPVVFGHHHEPPTYNAGETFTIGGGQLNYTIGGTDRTIPLTGAQIYIGPPITTSQITAGSITSSETIMPASEAARRIREAAEFVYNLPSPPETSWIWSELHSTARDHFNTTVTEWNWLEASETARLRARHPETGE